MEVLILCVRTWKPIFVRTSRAGDVKDDFLNIGTAESATAEDIHMHIQKTFQSLDLTDEFDNKLIGFCSDGASNMQGM